MCDQRPIYANECNKIFVRHNGYVKQVYGESLRKLKANSYLPLQINRIENLKGNETESEEAGINIFHYLNLIHGIVFQGRRN